MPVEPQTLTAANPFRSAARSHVGCVRRLNEDAVLARPEFGLWAVADGMGGHDAGEIASRIVLDEIQPKDGWPIRGTVREGLQRANRRLVAFAEKTGSGTIGSTVVVLLMEASRYVCIWAGDSRAYMLRGTQLTRLTRDHSAVQELVDAGVVAAADAAYHRQAHVITRAVGADATLDLDVCEGAVPPGATFLLCSDGITNLIADAELAEFMARADIDEAADAITALALKRHAPDNISLVLVRTAR